MTDDTLKLVRELEARIRWALMATTQPGHTYGKAVSQRDAIEQELCYLDVVCMKYLDHREANP